MSQKNKTDALIREALCDRIPAEWGKWVSCDSGWNWILEDLEKKLSYLDPNYSINQVKEKFGTLRFYFESSTDNSLLMEIMNDVVRTAETASASTCEICGNSSTRSMSDRDVKYDKTVGLRVRGGWYKTLCETCAGPNNYELLTSED